MPRRSASAAPDAALDLSHLSESERRQLTAVLQRDGELQDAERLRIVKMKSFVRQEDRSAEALLQRNEFNENYCIRCYRRFLLLINPWVCCCLCSLRVCRGRCAQKRREFDGFVCGVCDRSRLCQTGQCQWFYDAVKKKFRSSGSAKVVLSLSRDTQQFAEASHSASASQPGLAIEQIFAQPAHRQQHQLTDSGHGESLGRRPAVYRTELTFATRANNEEDAADEEEDFGFRAAEDFVGLTASARGGAAAAAAATVDDSAASTVGLQITSFQGQLHESLHQLQADLRAAVPDEERATSAEARQVAVRHAREVADLISTFAQTLHATLANRPGSPNSVDARVQRLVQQEVELAIGLSADRVFGHEAGAPAPSGDLDDGEDSGLAEQESRLAEFVVQKLLDDHMAALAESAASAAAAANCQDSAALPSYRRLPDALTPVKQQLVESTGAFRLRNDFCSDIAFATSSGSISLPQPQQPPTSKEASARSNLDQRQVDRHIDSLFAFSSSDSCSGGVKATTANQQDSNHSVAAASTPKQSFGTRHRLSDRLAAQPPQPSRSRADATPADGLRVGRFSARFVHDSVGDDDEVGGTDSWDLAAPVLPLTADAEAGPMLLRFSGFDWDQNERTDPRFCAKPDALVAVANGERVCLRAVVDGTEPFEVLWHRLKSGRAFEICNSDKYELVSDPQGDGSHCLTVYHASDGDAGAYLVVAANATHAVLHGFRLQVTENPRHSKPPEFTQPMSDTRSREGRTARFACRVAGQPTPRVTFLRDGKVIRPDGQGKYEIVSLENGGYELRINEVAKSDDAEYSCLATNAAGSTQCDCQLLVYRLAEDDEALRRIEGEIEQTQASMIAAAKDMYRASGKIRQLDANFGRLNKRLSSMERQLVTATAADDEEAYPESAALQRVTGHMLGRLAEHELSTTTNTTDTAATADASSLVWSSPSHPAGFSTSSFEAVPQSAGSSRIVYEIENVADNADGDREESGGSRDSSEAALRAAAVTERRIYVAASKTDLLRQKLDALERQILSTGEAESDPETERSLAALRLLADSQETEVAAIEAAADKLASKSP